ncbi:hypothetical protein ATO13_22451 [Stappia sp. 22II-S9-Z10]|nr:hypothetical protein ATO13_22451 [Stappia sp. 22II-S9-Z10]
MAILSAKLTGDGHRRLANAARDLSGAQTKRAYSRAINRTNDRAFTATKRALADQVGLSQGKVVALGQLRRGRATPAALSAEIKANSNHISLKEFGARQFGYGVRAKPWGEARRFDGAFIFAGSPRSGKPVKDGHAFTRTSGDSHPIEMMFGPNIAEELTKDQSRESWNVAANFLEQRILHEIRVIAKGVVS